jgi:hypothetical protein
MKVDSLVIYHSDGAKTFKTDPDDNSFETAVEECGVKFYGNGAISPYVKGEGETTVFVGFPFHYTIKEAEGGKDD